MKTPVSRIAPGKVILYRGEPCIVLEHRKEGTLLAVAEQIEQSFGKTNNFKDEDNALRVHLNGAFLDGITQGHPEEVITRTVDLTALNGSKEYGTVECKVAPLTLDELRKYHGILPNPESWEWSVTPWSTPCVDDDHTWVLGLSSGGSLGDHGCSDAYGSRPAFLIPSDFAVEDGLGNVMKTRDGEALAGSASASVDFAGVGAAPVATPGAPAYGTPAPAAYGAPPAAPAAPAYQPPVPGQAATTPPWSTGNGINPITGQPM